MNEQTPDGLQLRMWKPVLLRAVVAGIYGAVTIFWQDPDAAVMRVSGALYFAGTGAAIYWLQSVFGGGSRRSPEARALRPAALVLMAAAVVLPFLEPRGFSVTAAAALLLAGALELYLGIRLRRRTALARDWRITGVVNIGAALVLLLLPAFTPAQPHAVMGVLGGSAIIAAVVLILAALSLRSDAEAAPGGRGKAVN